MSDWMIIGETATSQMYRREVTHAEQEMMLIVAGPLFARNKASRRRKARAGFRGRRGSRRVVFAKCENKP